MWASKQVSQATYLHPDYYRTSIIGAFLPERLSVYQAVLIEMKTSNEIAAAMGRRPIFKNDFMSSRPREFGYLLRPTVKEFNDWIDKERDGGGLNGTRSSRRSNPEPWSTRLYIM